MTGAGVTGLTAVKASTGDVCGVSVVATGSDVRIDFLEQQAPMVLFCKNKFR